MKATADASERFMLVLVLVVAAAGVAAPAPGRALAAGNGIDAALAVLVFATGLSLRLADLAAVRLAWRRIAVVLLVSTAALPALAWAASQLIADEVLRSGMQAAGGALRTAWSPGPAVDDGVRLVTVLALLLLLWQVASQIRLDSAYITVIVALVVYVAGSAALGWVLALRAPAGQATAVLLPVAMRDFAVAAGIATAAFGPAAAAPLGAYGVLVLLAGSAGAILARRRPAAAG